MAHRRVRLMVALLLLSVAFWLSQGGWRQPRDNFELSFRLFNREVLGLTVRQLPAAQWQEGERHEKK